MCPVSDERGVVSDVAEVKEAIERWDSATGLERKRLAVVLLDAARRRVRVVEGLDYEAAVDEWVRFEGDDPQVFTASQRARLLEAVRVIVVAAVGVEKETSDEWCS